MRLGLIWKAVEPRPGTYDDAYLARIASDRRGSWPTQGIWTMLDFHQDLYNERFQGEGAPDWAVLRTTACRRSRSWASPSTTSRCPR